MADIKTIAKDVLDVAEDAIAWIAIWKTGRSWNACPFWGEYNQQTNELVFNEEDVEKVLEIAEADSGAILINGYHTNIGWEEGETLTVSTLADGIRYQYECKTFLLSNYLPVMPKPADETYPDDADHRQKKLIKIDRNGSKHFEGMVKCDRCGGTGWYDWGAVIDGVPQYRGVCFKCLGGKWVPGKWIERTPEYQAKLDAKREERWKAYLAEEEKREAERQRKAAERKAEQERIEAERKAEKARSQYVGNVGDKIECECTFAFTARFETNAFCGYGTTTMYVNTFVDADGNKLVWKTGSKDLSTRYEKDTKCVVIGTIKEHSEYKDEKQTILTRCKVSSVA